MIVQPARRVRRNPEQRALDLLQEVFGDKLTAAIDVKFIARHLGAELRPAGLDEDLAGMLVRDGDRTIIAYSNEHGQARQRFTIAHEIGHLMMHPGRPLIAETSHVVRLNKRMNTPGLADPREEREANQFAAALLMPADLVEHEWDRFAGKDADADNVFKALAAKFEVSRIAMRYRASNLGLYIPGSEPDENEVSSQ